MLNRCVLFQKAFGSELFFGVAKWAPFSQLELGFQNHIVLAPRGATTLGSRSPLGSSGPRSSILGTSVLAALQGKRVPGGPEESGHFFKELVCL